MNDRDKLIAASLPFLAEIQNMTAGTAVEQWLNAKYGPGSALYEELAALVKAGVEAGWAASTEIQGRRYRRSRICEPTPETLGFSITAVYMDSTGNTQGNPEQSFRGDYHAHPYGEFNMVIPLNEGAALAGPNGWCYGGWTAPSPGSHHYPEAKGGAVIALFYLPAGRISYDIAPPA
ncbi:DUF4863 family protein [Variovorax soli]|uniref:DUF4863 family protein n=1 Tax=Variovorax soli TaxID=376815 RepID=A0ABU1NLS0_9BURK|nr:hypothetical protein [Variovorax soli]